MDVALTCDDPTWDAAVDLVFRREVRNLELVLIRCRRTGQLQVEVHPASDGGSEVALAVAGQRVRVAHPELPQAVHGAFAGVCARLLPATDDAGPDEAVEATWQVYPALVRSAGHYAALAVLEDRVMPTEADPNELAVAAVADVLPYLDPHARPREALTDLQQSVRAHLAALEHATDGAPLDERIRRVSEVFEAAEEAEEESDPWHPEDDPSLADALLAEREPGADAERLQLVIALFRLSPAARRAWVAAAIDGWPRDALAAAQGTTAGALDRQLAEIRADLARQLGRAEADVDEAYAALGGPRNAPCTRPAIG